MTKRTDIDMLNGPLLPSIVRFSIPIIVGSLLTTLFNIADSVVLGQMAGTDYVAAVGACATLCSLIVNLFTGLTTGVNVVIPRIVGVGDKKLMREAVSTAILMAAVMGAAGTVFGILFSKPILQITNCPPECLNNARLYLSIYILSVPAMVIYHFGAAIVRISGNTKTPTYYLTFSGALNVVLNFVLCLILPQKIIAVAAATVVSQTVSAVLVLRYLFRGKEGIGLDIHDLKFNWKLCGKIIRFGLPSSLNNCMFSFAGIQIQSAINSYGTAAVAGNSAATGLEGLIGCFAGGFSNACITFCGQSIGAKKKERVGNVIRTSLLCGLTVTFAVSMIVMLFRRPLLGLYTPDNPAAIDYGCIRMNYIIRFFIISTTNTILGGIISMFGYSIISLIDSLITVFAFRVVWMTFIYPKYETFNCLMLCYFVSWLLMLTSRIITSIILYIRFKHGKGRRII